MSGREFKRFAVVDVEATCQAEDEVTERHPDDKSTHASHYHEIIQIGLVIVQVSTCEVIERHSLFVYPKFTRVTEDCTNLTGITPEMLKGEPRFPDACRTLIKMGLRNMPVFTLGEFDLKDFRVDSERWMGPRWEEIFPFNPLKFHNLHSLLCIFTGSKKKKGLIKALDHHRLTFDGSHHRADDDAYNTYRIIAAMVRAYQHGLAAEVHE